MLRAVHGKRRDALSSEHGVLCRAARKHFRLAAHCAKKIRFLLRIGREAHDADLFPPVKHPVAGDTVAHAAAKVVPLAGKGLPDGDAGTENDRFRFAEVRPVDNAEAPAERGHRRGASVKELCARIERLPLHRLQQRTAGDVRAAGVIGDLVCAEERDIVDPAGEDRRGFAPRAQRERRGNCRRAAAEDHSIIFHMVFSCRLFRRWRKDSQRFHYPIILL